MEKKMKSGLFSKEDIQLIIFLSGKKQFQIMATPVVPFMFSGNDIKIPSWLGSVFSAGFQHGRDKSQKKKKKKQLKRIIIASLKMLVCNQQRSAWIIPNGHFPFCFFLVQPLSFYLTFFSILRLGIFFFYLIYFLEFLVADIYLL